MGILQRLHRDSAGTVQRLYKTFTETENPQIFCRDSAETLQGLVRDFPEIVQRERTRESHSKVISEIDVAFCALWHAGSSG